MIVQLCLLQCCATFAGWQLSKDDAMTDGKVQTGNNTTPQRLTVLNAELAQSWYQHKTELLAGYAVNNCTEQHRTRPF